MNKIHRRNTHILAMCFLSTSTLILSSCFGLFEPSSDQSEESSTQINTPLLDRSSLLGVKIIGLEKYAPNMSDNGNNEYLINQAGQEFTLRLNLKNDYKYKITSVRVENINYEEISSSNGYKTVDVKMNAKMDYGIQTFCIQKINYLYGDKEEQLTINSFKFTLKLPHINEVKIENWNVNPFFSTIDLNFDIVDKDNILNNLTLFYILEDCETHKNLKDTSYGIQRGHNSLKLENLNENHKYKISFKYLGDFRDYGGRYINNIFQSYEIATRKSCDILNVVPDYKSVTFEVFKEVGVTFDSVQLFDKSDGLLISEILDDKREFNNLLTDHEYEIRVNVSFEGEGFSQSITFKTKSYVLPTFKFAVLDEKNQSISYEVKIIDEFNLGTFIGVELKEMFQRKDFKNTIKGTFAGLKPGYVYYLNIYYSYDLDDGNGVVNKTYEQEVSTKPIDTQNINLNLSVNNNAINYKFDNLLRDDVSLLSVDLYQNKELILTNNDKLNEGKFENLYNNLEYVVKANYKMDLPLENDTYIGSVESKITTSKLSAPTVQISTTFGKRNIAFNLDVTDKDNICSVKSVSLYKGEMFIENKLEQLSGEFVNLNTNTEYIVKVLYEYNFNELRNHEAISKVIETKVTTDSFVAPSFELTNPVIGARTFEATVTCNDPDKTITSFGDYEARNLHRFIEPIHINSSYPKFSELFPGEEYHLSREYTYDLLDGKGEITKYLTYDFKTLNKCIVTDFKITPYNMHQNDEYTIHIELQNHKQYSIFGLNINDQWFFSDNANDGYGHNEGLIIKIKIYPVSTVQLPLVVGSNDFHLKQISNRRILEADKIIDTEGKNKCSVYMNP